MDTCEMFNRNELGDVLNRLGLFGEGVEVGVASGDFSARILDRWRGRRLHMIDPWRHLDGYVDRCNVDDGEHEAKRIAAEKAVARFGERARLAQGLSPAAADGFADGSLDFVYIDANHEYASVAADLRAWWPKVKPGGLFAGHDYLDGVLHEGIFGVKLAVDEFAREVGVTVHVTTEKCWRSWYFRK